MQKLSKQNFMEKWDSRKDKWANEVRLSCCGDLVAADARYHVDCRTQFMNGKQLPGSETVQTSYQSSDEHDDAFDILVQQMDDKR